MLSGVTCSGGIYTHTPPLEALLLLSLPVRRKKWQKNQPFWAISYIFVSPPPPRFIPPCVFPSKKKKKIWCRYWIHDPPLQEHHCDFNVVLSCRKGFYYKIVVYVATILYFGKSVIFIVNFINIYFFFHCTTGCYYQHRRHNEVHNSAGIEVYYQTDMQSSRANMLLEIFCQMIGEPCFDTLRTKEQLGKKYEMVI